MGSRRRTLLTPGNPEWTALEREKRELLRPRAEVPVEELLRRGIRLSAEAGRLMKGVERRPDDRTTPTA